LGGWFAEFAYRTNSCGPGDHVIQSETDAIEVAKKKMVKERKFSSERAGLRGFAFRRKGLLLRDEKPNSLFRYRLGSESIERGCWTK
jgi:hypothetical protein